jgi:hypothetical protein
MVCLQKKKKKVFEKCKSWNRRGRGPWRYDVQAITLPKNSSLLSKVPKFINLKDNIFIASNILKDKPEALYEGSSSSIHF